MSRRILLFLALFLVLGISSKAQDFHFTQYYLSPLTLNPAHTGYFYGTARLGGNYRMQGFGGATNQGASALLYRTYALNVDSPILLGLSEKHWIGVGGAMIRDDAGTLRSGLGSFHGSVAYHIGLGKSKKGRSGKGIVARVKSAAKAGNKRTFEPSKTYLSIGATYGSRMWTVDENGAERAGGVFNVFQDPSETLKAGQNSQRKTTEIGVGLMLNSKLSNTSDLQIGASAFHLLSEDIPAGTEKLMGGGGAVRSKDNMKISAHLEYNTLLSDKISLHPRLLYRAITEASEISAQGIVGYRFSEEKDITLLAGLGYRLTGDAAEIILGGKVKDLRVGLAYDLAVAVPDARSGLELGVQYIIKIYKKPSADPVIFCPRL